jgi:hypothetical protein
LGNDPRGVRAASALPFFRTHAAGDNSGSSYGLSRTLAAPVGGADENIWLSLLERGPSSLPFNSGGTFDGFNFSFNATGAGSFYAGAFTGLGGFVAPKYTIAYPDFTLGSLIVAQSSTPSSLQALLVVNVQFGTTNSEFIDLFVNPPVGGTAPTTPDATLSISTGADLLSPFSLVTLFGEPPASDLYDELRIGSTFASVTPVPEPATLGLTCLVTVGWVTCWRRWRAAKGRR